MARLQDFPSVTPTSSDKLLIVQSQGQGLATIGSLLKSSNVTVSMSSTTGQYVTDLDWNTYRIVNAWISGQNNLIITRPTLTGKVVFNIYRYTSTGSGYDFQPISDSSITVNFFYL